jgi:hypothetical protein
VLGPYSVERPDTTGLSKFDLRRVDRCEPAWSHGVRASPTCSPDFLERQRNGYAFDRSGDRSHVGRTGRTGHRIPTRRMRCSRMSLGRWPECAGLLLIPYPCPCKCQLQTHTASPLEAAKAYEDAQDLRWSADFAGSSGNTKRRSRWTRIWVELTPMWR